MDFLFRATRAGSCARVRGSDCLYMRPGMAAPGYTCGKTRPESGPDVPQPEDLLALDEPLEIRLGAEKPAVPMRTPGHRP